MVLRSFQGRQMQFFFRSGGDKVKRATKKVGEDLNYCEFQG